MDKLKRWTDMTWIDINETRGEMIALIPCGSVEQHGPHLPTGTDLYIAQGIADKLAGAGLPCPAERLVMTPPFFHTYAKESDAWPGTLNLDGATLALAVRDVAEGLFRQGIKNIVLLNGHMESYAFIMEGLQLATGDKSGVKAISVNWWDFISDGLIDKLFGDKWPGWVAEHAALTETSIMLYLRPELVRMELSEAGVIPAPLPYKIFPQKKETLPPSGMFARADGASADIGKILVDEVVNKLAPIIEENFRN
ncbi:creatininase family protein [Cloacibacillus sp. An23]|uniref:creatininase family protein n=1 Tax=Cloacibacillus sp. An23 TaxID=1965591 RepID=UPI001302A1B9|nr:creatininase family protein [Cloacibacillus sp. An23]